VKTRKNVPIASATSFFVMRPPCQFVLTASKATPAGT
jgi:hypothetical protein